MEHLDGDVAAVLEVLGQKDSGHAPPTQLALDGIRPGERVPQCPLQISQDGPLGKDPSVAPARSP